MNARRHALAAACSTMPPGKDAATADAPLARELHSPTSTAEFQRTVGRAAAVLRTGDEDGSASPASPQLVHCVVWAVQEEGLHVTCPEHAPLEGFIPWRALAKVCCCRLLSAACCHCCRHCCRRRRRPSLLPLRAAAAAAVACCQADYLASQAGLACSWLLSVCLMLFPGHACLCSGCAGIRRHLAPSW